MNCKLVLKLFATKFKRDFRKPPRLQVSAVVTLVATSLLVSVGTVFGDVPSDAMVLWLDAANRDERAAAKKPTAETSQPLAAWSDLSGLKNHLIQDDLARQPQWVASGIGGRPSVRFHGDDLLHRNGFGGLSIGDQPLHIAIVFQAPRGGPPAQRLIDLNSRAVATNDPEKRRGFWVGFQQGRYIPRLGIHYGDEGEALSAVWDEQPHLLELVYDGEQHFRIHVDGRTERQAMFNGTHFLGFQPHVTFAIGQHFGLENNDGTWFNGLIAEVLIYRRPLTTPERFALGTHLTEKYSLKTEFELPPLFEQDIRPILARHCFECHGADTREQGLDLRTVSSMLHGGKAGPVIVRGHPEHSEMFAMLESDRMPPKDSPRLTAKEINLIKRWIQTDAPADEKVVVKRPPARVSRSDREHWAWQMPTIGTPPDVNQTQRVRNEIDRFVLARLQDEGLMLSPDATPEQQIRRVYFDVIGLPPSPAEIDAFLQDKHPGRFGRLVDRLLKSHHFGERWGRHWLDVAGFVDVTGSDNDAPIIKPLPGKWRYRDYVIRSFNDDKPFDRFLVEQLAGDELFDWPNAAKFTPSMLESLTATAFLLSANDDTDQNELNTPDVRHHVLQRVSENVANSLFAVTLQCAKCHDHKYEAVSQLDYYRFESVFAPIFNVRNWVTSNARTRANVSDAEQIVIDGRNGEIDAETKKRKQRRNKIRTAHRRRLFDIRLAKIPESDREAARTAVNTISDKRNEQQKQLAAKYGTELTVSDADINTALSDDEQSELETIAKQIAALESDRRTYQTISLATESSAPATTHVLRRGNYLKPGLEVTPELPEVLVPGSAVVPLTADSHSGLSGRRLALARAVTDPESLAGNHVARVFVNRVWQQLFGRGIVETADNFGVSGARPTHPKLLDWLTRRFIENGWKVKPLIRQLVLSSTYRQSAQDADRSRDDEPAKRRGAVDPHNRLLWRMNLRRLDSEQLRDAILTVSGKLDRTLGGPPIPLKPRPDGMVVLNTDALPAGTTPFRRSVYILARRNYHLTFMRVFDQPIVARNCAARKPSAVVTQSLALLHDDFMFEQSEILAERVAKESLTQSAEDRIRIAFRIVVGRFPDDDETSLCLQLLNRHADRYAKMEQKSEQTSQQRALVQLCHMLLNTSEFLYVP